MTFSPYFAPANRPKDLPIQNFAGIGGGATSQTVVSQYDLYHPNELMEVFARHNNRPGFRLMLKTYGFDRGTAAPTTGHYEYPWREDLVAIGSIVTASTGPGTDVVVALDASSMYDTSVTVGGTAAKASYPRENFMLYFADGNKGIIVKKDTSTDPHRLTIRPLKATVDLATSIVAGEEYFISDSAFAEGSGLPSGVTPRIITYTNTFQITKEAAYATGSSLTNKMYFKPVKGVEGAFYRKVEEDTMYRFEVGCDGKLIWGQTIDNHSVYVPFLGHDAPVTGTEGLMDFTATNSFVDTYTPGSYTLTDFDTLASYYEDERLGSSALQCWDGFDIFLENENLLQGLYNDNMDVLTERMLGLDTGDPDDEFQSVKNTDWVVNVGFKAIRKGGFIFAFKKMHEFNKAMGAGSSDYNYKQWRVVMPIGMTKDKSTNQNVPTVGYEYKLLGDYSREVCVGTIAGIGVGGTNGYIANAVHTADALTMGLVGEHAFHGACPNAIVVQKP